MATLKVKYHLRKLEEVVELEPPRTFRTLRERSLAHMLESIELLEKSLQSRPILEGRPEDPTEDEDLEQTATASKPAQKGILADIEKFDPILNKYKDELEKENPGSVKTIIDLIQKIKAAAEKGEAPSKEDQDQLLKAVAPIKDKIQAAMKKDPEGEAFKPEQKNTIVNDKGLRRLAAELKDAENEKLRNWLNNEDNLAQLKIKDYKTYQAAQKSLENYIKRGSLLKGTKDTLAKLIGFMNSGWEKKVDPDAEVGEEGGEEGNEEGTKDQKKEKGDPTEINLQTDEKAGLPEGTSQKIYDGIIQYLKSTGGKVKGEADILKMVQSVAAEIK